MKLRLVSLLFLLISFGALFYVILSINGQNVTVSDPRVTEARVSGTHLSTEKVRNTANIEENMRRNEDVVHSVSRGSDFLNNRQCPELASNTGHYSYHACSAYLVLITFLHSVVILDSARE